MGSFDGHCPFTNTAITVGERVLIVVLTKAMTTYEIHHKIEDYNRKKKPSPFEYVNIGTYNDYGYIHEAIDFPYDEWFGKIILVHERVVEKLLSVKLDALNQEQLLKVADKLVQKAYRLRVELYPSILGQQFLDLKDLKEQKKLIKITQEIIKSQKESFRTLRS